MKFPSPLIRGLAVVVTILVLSACASKSAVVEEPPTIAANRIVLLPVENPYEMYVQNRNLLLEMSGVLFLGQTLVNQEKTKKFAAAIEAQRLSMGKKMTLALKQELKQAGYEVYLMEGVKGPPDDPDNVDYTKLPTDDPVLHLWFGTTAMYSSRFRGYYEHQVDVAARLIAPKTEAYLYDESIYYGAESDGEDYWSIPGNPNRRYGNFEELMARQDEVIEEFDTSIRSIARHISKEFITRFGQPAPRP